MVKIWLDDIRPAPDNWLWAKTADECYTLLYIHMGDVEVLSLDHDLGDADVPTGYDLVKRMCQHTDYSDILPAKIYLHTSNPVGRENMFSLLTRFRELCIADGTLEREVVINKGPNLYSWEASMRKSRKLGYF